MRRHFGKALSEALADLLSQQGVADAAHGTAIRIAGRHRGDADGVDARLQRP